jgi:hypothetical protein
MNRTAKGVVLGALGLGVVLGVVAGAGWKQPALANAALQPAGGPRYDVVLTEGHNLIVTDNQTNTLYFYSIEQDAGIGSDFKLRGKVDLTQVGKDTVKPTVYFKKEKEK